MQGIVVVVILVYSKILNQTCLVVKLKKEKKKATIVQNEAEDVPTEEDSSKYLEDMEMLKLQNEQSKMLGIIDMIINMMKEGKIVGQDINQKILDSIVVTVVEGEQPTEYICSQITKKWIMYRFQIRENDQFSVDFKMKNFVQIMDKLENTLMSLDWSSATFHLFKGTEYFLNI